MILLASTASLASSQNFYYKPFPVVEKRSSPSYPSPPSYEPEAPAKYDFEWQVLDTYSGNDFGHQESRNDAKTTGSYHVALPDGRVQRVTYFVDGYGGYHAEVTYEGDAKYPAYVAASEPRPTYVRAEAKPVVEAEPVEPEPVVTTPSPPPVVSTYPPVVTSTYAPVVSTYPPLASTYAPVASTYPPVVKSYAPIVSTYPSSIKR